MTFGSIRTRDADAARVNHVRYDIGERSPFYNSCRCDFRATPI
jgi:hypothetical protein